MFPADELQFDPNEHVYTVGGKRWPSVTQILDPLQELEGIPRIVLEAAAKFGSHVHEACHLANLGTLDFETLDPALRPYVLAWQAFQVDFGAIVIASEMRVKHASLHYAGTLDSICRIGGQRELVDIKATAALPITVGPQTAGYAAALGEPRIRRRVVRLKNDGTYQQQRLANPADWNVFLSALNIHNFRFRRNGP